jgi:hypothetical protein
MASEGKRRWRPVRSIFKEGIEAALRAEPYFLATTKTRTTLGWIIRELVLDAGRGKMTALKAMLSLLDWEEPEESGETQEILDEPQRDEPQWEWTSEGVWEGRPESEEEREAEEQAEQERAAIIEEIEDGSAKAKLLQLLRRREAFKEEERQCQARLAEAAASANTADPPAPAPTMAATAPVVAIPPAAVPSPPDDGVTWVETNGCRFRLGTRP